MTDINLQSAVLTLDGFPAETRRVMFIYDNRGWGIRCYDKNGTKITTLIFTDKEGDETTEGTLHPEEQNQKASGETQGHGDNCRCLKLR